MGLKNGASYQLNAPLFETSEKNVIFGDFFAFFLQLTIRPLQRFFIIYLLFSIFCRNFASFFVRYSLDNGSTMARQWLDGTERNRRQRGRTD